MKPKLTPELLREHAAADRNTLAWKDGAMTLLNWAADALEAAEAVMAERCNTREER